MGKFYSKRLFFILLAFFALILTKFAQHNTDWIENIYSQTIYPILLKTFGFLPSLFNFSVGELILYIFIIFCFLYLLYFLQKIITAKKDRGLILYHFSLNVLAMLCSIFFIFTIFCGLNYYRHTFTYHTGYKIEQYTTEELEQLCRNLATDLNLTRNEIGNDKNIFAGTKEELNFYSNNSIGTIEHLGTKYSVFNNISYSAPKHVFSSKIMSMANITGMFFPFTFEANINTDVPFFTTQATMVHELAHQSGFMREEEANFIAYLGCRDSDDPLVRYSGQYLAFSHSISALRTINPSLASEIIAELSAPVKNDMNQSYNYWSQYDGIFSKASSFANDKYLKANNQSGGVQSYNQMVSLLLAEQRFENSSKQ